MRPFSFVSPIAFTRWVFKDKRGDTMVTGLILTAVVASAAVTAERYYASFTRQSKITQIRSMMQTIEAAVRQSAFQPYVYRCGSESGAEATAGIASCKLITLHPDPAVVADPSLIPSSLAKLMFTEMPTALCKAGRGKCGIRAFIDEIDSTTTPNDDLHFTVDGSIGKFKAKIVYTGDDYKLAPIYVNLDIPSDLLQSSRFNCAQQDIKKPVFVGFRPDGGADCRGLQNDPCPQGTYAVGVDFKALKINCQAMGDMRAACSGQKFVNQVNWNEGKFTYDCGDLPPAPFTEGMNATPPPTATPTPSRRTRRTVHISFPGAQCIGPRNSRCELNLNVRQVMPDDVRSAKIVGASFAYQHFQSWGGPCMVGASVAVPGEAGGVGQSGECRRSGAGTLKCAMSTYSFEPTGGGLGLSSYTSGWGDCGGSPCNACLSNVEGDIEVEVPAP